MANSAIDGTILNSKEYWDVRFATGDWSAKGGLQHTEVFTRTALERLPPWVIEEIRGRRMSAVDWGCAEGQGVELLSVAFPDSAVLGVDISEQGVLRARQRYPTRAFESFDLFATDRTFDVVFSSNTLEHMNDPSAALRSLARHARELMVLLVPFQEVPRHEEHLTTFDYGSFPLLVEDLQGVYAAEIDMSQVENAPVTGKQLLLVYARRASRTAEQASLGTLFADVVSRSTVLSQQLQARLDELRKLYDWTKGLITERDQVRAELNAVVGERELLRRTAEERHEELARLYEWVKGLVAGAEAKDRDVEALKIDLQRLHGQIAERELRLQGQIAERELRIKTLEDAAAEAERRQAEAARQEAAFRMAFLAEVQSIKSAIDGRWGRKK